jgi:hypothetical protein
MAYAPIHDVTLVSERKKKNFFDNDLLLRDIRS